MAWALTSVMKWWMSLDEEYPAYHYATAFPEEYVPKEVYDYILFSDIGETADIQGALVSLRAGIGRHSRLVVYRYNALWGAAGGGLVEKFDQDAAT